MTGKERILAVLSGDIPDRVPVCPFVQDEYLNDYFGRTDCSRVTEAAALANELHFDVLTRDIEPIEPFYTRQSYTNWEIAKRQYLDRGIVHRVLTITTPKGVLTQQEAAPYDPATLGGIHFSTKEFLLKNLEEDLEIFRTYMPEPSLDYRNNMKERAEWATRTIGEAGLACPWGTGGVYNTASTLRSLEDLMCDPYDDEDLYVSFMTYLTDSIVRDYEWLAETDYDIIGMQGNIANAAMLSCDFFENMGMPYEDRVIAAVAQRGKHTLYHNCGMARNLYPAYKRMNMTVFETLSPPPQGDNSLAEAKAVLGQTKVLSGNLDQVYFLKTATPREVADLTCQVVETGKPGGRCLFSCSDYLEKGTPLENVKAMIRAAKEAGVY